VAGADQFVIAKLDDTDDWAAVQRRSDARDADEAREEVGSAEGQSAFEQHRTVLCGPWAISRQS
jgi:hypothetical protein